MSINNIYLESLLAQAAYADGLTPGMTGAKLADELVKIEGVSRAQAEYFASQYTVIHQDEVIETGFSGTLFQHNDDKTFHLALRGTDFNGPDVSGANTNNVQNGMAFNQVAGMINFYLRLTHSGDVPQFGFRLVENINLGEGQVSFPYIENDEHSFNLVFEKKSDATGLGIAGLNTSTQLMVSGHSLGGHLASAFSLLLPSVIGHTSTFNSAGIIGDNFSELANLIANEINIDGILNIAPVSEISSVTDIRAPFDPISDPFAYVTDHLSGSPTDVYIEADRTEFSDSHKMDRLTDSLAVANAMNTLDEALDIATYNQFFKVSANDENITLEALTNHLASLFGTTNVEVVDSDHDDVYKSLNSLTNLASHNSYRFTAVGSDIVVQALSGDKAALYAIVNLQPFVVKGTTQGFTDALYQTHSANGALDIENYSQQYLIDRAAMLQWLIKYNESDEAYGSYLNPDDFPDTAGFDGNVTYTDLSSEVNKGQDLILKIDGDGIAIPYEQIKFGTEYDDGIAGAGNDDRLYGCAGKDSILGKDGDDYLEGGKGNDTLLGGKGADKLYGGEGDDHLEAGQEDVYGKGALNELYAGDGNDTLIGGHGIDSLFGGAGDDSLWVGKGAVNVLSPTEGYIIGWEYMVGGEGFDSYYIGTSSNINTIIDSDGDGEIFVNAENIGDETYKLTGGAFWGEQTITDRPEGDLEADGYTQIHADGSTSNFTVAYELDGSQTLIAYGFNIYNFYNGMLGINLVGGRVTDVQSDLNGVLASLNFEGDFDTTEKERIKVALTKAYNQSETMKTKLIEYAITNGNSINIQASANGINTSIGSREDSINFAATGSGVASATNNNTIYIDLNWLENNTYISTTGKAVADTLETALIHELVHLIDSLTDPLAHGEKGETVEVANTIYLEMGLPEQASYFAYDPSGNTHEANFGYTNGEEIDRAYTLLSENLEINDIDTSTGGNLDDLIIGNERDNSLAGGEGRDFLYGNEGDDRLIGEDGDDELHGGAGADLIYGGSGSDTAAYTASHSGININLNSGSAGGGDAKGDSLSNIENISGSAYSDNITGDAQDNRLEGLDGDDIISGGFGDDELIGGAGNDSLTGIYGDNIFEGNLGDDVLIGGIGNDTLTGGLGNDILKGGTGNDSYLFNVGDGEDILTDASGIDKIVFGEGITANNIRMSADTTQLHWIVELLDINGATTDDKVWIREANIDTDNQIESFEFSDGTSLGVDEIRALIEGTTSDGSTDIENVIYGNFPEGPLYGTDGNDLLIGLHGAHSYHIDAFAGHDVIDGATEHPSGELVLHDIYDWQISAIRDGNDLVINILSGEEQSIRIVDQYLGLGIDQITVRDSDPNDDSVRTVYYVDIGNRAPYHTYGSTKYFNKELNDLFRPPANGYDGFDFDGSELAELIDGTEGNDTFNGVKGDDTLTGSLEDDTLIGGSEGSSMDSNLNLLIQSYSSFDDASDESEGELSKERYSIVPPVLEYVV